MRCRTACFILLACAAPALAQERLHFEEPGFALSAPQRDYYDRLRKILIGIGDRNLAHAIVIPPAGPEYVLMLNEDDTQFLLTARILFTRIEGAKADAGKVAMSADGKITSSGFSTGPSDYADSRRCAAKLDKATGARVVALWRNGLLAIRYDGTRAQKPPGGGEYHFYAVHEMQFMTGYAYTPPREASAGLSHLVRLLRAYCESPEPQTLSTITAETTRLERQAR